jgi:bifunctional non-homologous end joining protein LigD
VEKPDFLTWDLDPDAAVPWRDVLGAAALLRDFLRDRGLEPMIKTSGGKGLHLVLKIRRSQPWDVMREFAKAVSAEIGKLGPKRFTIVASKAKRTGKIFIDWMRNGRGSTCIAPWCLRARPGAPVSMPFSWDRLGDLPQAGFAIHEPPETPPEWLDPPAQNVPVSLLRELGALRDRALPGQGK